MSDTQQGASAPVGLTVDEVFSTIGYSGFVKSLFNSSGSQRDDFIHAALGVATEVHEAQIATDFTNLIEEIGDCQFYAEALRQVVGDPAGNEDVRMARAALEAPDAVVAAGYAAVARFAATELLDMAKRWVGYGKEPTEGQKRLAVDYANLALIRILPDEFAGAAAPSQKDVQRVNVAKLLKRYNGIHFSAERALNRDLPAERATLEHAAG